MENNTQTPVVNTETPVASIASEAAVSTPERPEWLPEKFKAPEDLAKSYKELETHQRNTFGAPEQYSWNLNDQEPDGVKIFKQVAKENNLSQKAFEEMTNSYLNKEKVLLEARTKQMQEDSQKIRNEIGEDRLARANNLLATMGLSAEQLQVLDRFSVGVQEFEVLESMLGKINNSVSAANVNVATIPAPDIQKELDQILGSRDYDRHPGKYEARVMELLRLQELQK